MASPAVALHDVVVRRAGRTILGPVTWRIEAGQRWVVLGPNGSGKTTLTSVAGMRLWPTSGTVEVLGERYGRTDARDMWRRVGIAGSALETMLRGDLTPHTLIMAARHGATEPWWHVYDESDHARALALADRLGIGDRAEQTFETLSAGERRRVSIARALMPDPDLLILDEPAANLDLAARERLLADLDALAQGERPVATILVTHHLEEIPAGFEHALVLAEGRIVGLGPIADVLRDDVLETAFGLPLAVASHEGRWTARLRR
ncbi:MAG: ABC transporter ATP-binding protein [Candidatus Limnocylindria bacterium]